MLSGALLSAGCDLSEALNSDPAAWNPPPGRVSAPVSPGAAGATAEVEGCDQQSPPTWSGTASAATTVSHRSGEPCLEGCHEPGGSARLAFAVAGTAHEGQGERQPARAGRLVQGVGGTVLTVDICGNFYALEEALAVAPGRTQPWVKDPTFRRMEKPLTREARPGDCNQSGCHDFSSKLSVGIYF